MTPEQAKAMPGDQKMLFGIAAEIVAAYRFGKGELNTDMVTDYAMAAAKSWVGKIFQFSLYEMARISMEENVDVNTVILANIEQLEKDLPSIIDRTNNLRTHLFALLKVENADKG